MSSHVFTINEGILKDLGVFTTYSMHPQLYYTVVINVIEISIFAKRPSPRSSCSYHQLGTRNLKVEPLRCLSRMYCLSASFEHRSSTSYSSGLAYAIEIPIIKKEEISELTVHISSIPYPSEDGSPIVIPTFAKRSSPRSPCKYHQLHTPKKTVPPLRYLSPAYLHLGTLHTHTFSFSIPIIPTAIEIPIF